MEIAIILSKKCLPIFYIENFIKRNDLIDKIINSNYDIESFISELNRTLQLFDFKNNDYIIDIFDLFSLSLLLPELDKNSSVIKKGNEYTFKWMKFIISKCKFTKIFSELDLKLIQNENIYRNPKDNSNVEKHSSEEKYVDIMKNKFISNKNKYFIKYIKNKNSVYFIDFNNNKIKYKNKNENFKNNDILYKLIDNNNNELLINEYENFIKYEFNIEDYKESNLDNNAPFFVFGKIFEKNNNNLLLLSKNLNNIIFINDKQNILKNIKENHFFYFSFLKINNIYKNYVYAETTIFTEIKEEKNNIEEIDIINEKILIKVNTLDFKEKNLYNSIKFFCFNREITFDIYNNIIYFFYCENEYFQEYFPQQFQLFNNKNQISPIFTMLALKGYCNELNLSLNNTNGILYEYYYIGKKKYLPEKHGIIFNNNIYEKGKLWKYETNNRKKITFVNIPLQEKLGIDNFKSILKIYTCTSSKIGEYGNFLLDKLYLQKKEEIKINQSFEELLKDIIEDIDLFLKSEEEDNNIKKLVEKYITNKNNNYKKEYSNELKEDYRLFYMPNTIEIFNYFNKVCIWNIMINCNSNYWKYYFQKYFDIYNKIKNKNIDFSEKTFLLISVFRRAKEEDEIIFPEIIFFDEYKEDYNAYTKAYHFHLKLIDNLNEESKLMKPFLQLNSYIMDKILTFEEKEKIRNTKIDIIKKSIEDNDEKNKYLEEINKDSRIESAYTISMISTEIIKKHLKKTMKPYALIFHKNSKRDYLASVNKDNNIICFNEEEIFKNIPTELLYSNNYMIQRKDDFAFILNLLFLHENSSHNKEKIINLKVNSPLIYLNDEYKYSLNIIDNNIEEGEAGYFTESFIGKRNILLGLINCENKLGALLDVKYFIQDNFDELIEKYEKIKSVFEKTDDNYITEYAPFNESNDIKIIRKSKIGSIIRKTKKNEYGFTEHEIYLFRLSKERSCDY